MPPDYESQEYWNARFQQEHHFEWLGDGSDTLLPILRAHLPSVTPSPARLLHIGAGTSSLCERLRELYIAVYDSAVDARAIVHADFALGLVERRRATEEAAHGARSMSWACADVLKWIDMRALLEVNVLDQDTAGTRNLYDIVVDKSTSDAISCGEEVALAASDPSTLHPALRAWVTAARGGDGDDQTRGAVPIGLSPMELLAIHLAAIVRPGGLWAALTFSSSRFAFLAPPSPPPVSARAPDPAQPRAAAYWAIERVETVDAPTGAEGGGAHAPIVHHFIVLIRRNDVPLPLGS